LNIDRSPFGFDYWNLTDLGLGEENMDLTLSAEQQMIRDLWKNFAKNEIAPDAEELDYNDHFPYEIWKKMADLEIVGIPGKFKGFLQQYEVL
jgi:hypothetical protein